MHQLRALYLAESRRYDRLARQAGERPHTQELGQKCTLIPLLICGLVQLFALAARNQRDTKRAICSGKRVRSQTARHRWQSAGKKARRR